MRDFLILPHEEDTARKAISHALANGAQKVRITLSKSVMDLVGTLDGEIDKVSHCMDRSLAISLFVDGRFGSFSTNRLDDKEIGPFIDKAIDTVRMLAADEFRTLPDKGRKATDATGGMELGLYDPAYDTVSSTDRVKMAMDAILGKAGEEKPSKLISEEGEYSDSCYDSIVMDSEGLYARHTETSFEYGVEMTVEDGEGNRYSGYWWHAAPFLKDLEIAGCGRKAYERACSQIGSKEVESGKKTLVVDSEVASKLVTPVLNALGAYALQQNNSFLRDSLGKKVFPEGMTINDRCRNYGETGSRLFDSEGVATKDSAIIRNGVIEQYFVNTYMSGKMGIAPTIEDATRPKVEPFPKPGLDRENIMQMCGEGILVTGFNGGNSNSATGDFSYGIEGFAFKDGKIQHPVSEMLITGNFITLWNNLIAAGDDARLCMSKLTPTLAFAEVDFSA